MTRRWHATATCAGTTLLAALPLATVFERWTWLVSVLGVVVAMTAAAVGLRRRATQRWIPSIGMAIAYLLVLTWLFGRDQAMAGIIPGPATFAQFNDLLVQAGLAIRDSGVPVADDPALFFLAALGVGGMHLAVDAVAVVVRRPALAGIPMVGVYVLAVGTHTNSVSVLSFFSTAAAYLWLLAADKIDRVRRFGQRFTATGHAVDAWEPLQLAAAGRRVAVAGVIAAVLVPMAVPGMSTGLWQRFGSGTGEGSGFGNGAPTRGRVNMFSNLSGALTRERAYDMVNVTTTDPSPFYLQFGVADELTNNGFGNRAWSEGQPLRAIFAPSPPAGSGVATQTFTADVEVLNFAEKVLPVFQYPTRMSGPGGAWRWDQAAGVVYSDRASAQGLKYSFEYSRFGFSPDTLRTASVLPADHPIQQRYTQLPDVRAVKNQAAQLVAGKTNPYDKARAIHQFFSVANGFRYSLRTKPGNSGSRIVDFLTNKEGFCEQYAAAMGWLARAAGLPARVAFGFTRGNNRQGNTYLLTNFNLHAWTEIYFDRFGWVPFDATPASAIAGGVSTSWAPDSAQPSTPSLTEPEDDLSASGQPSTTTTAPVPNQFGDNDPAAGSSTGDAGVTWPFHFLAVLLAVMAAAVPGVWRAMLRRRRSPGRRPMASYRELAIKDRSSISSESGAMPLSDRAAEAIREDAHGAWRELTDTLADFRILLRSTESPRACVQRLITQCRLADEAASAARALAQAEENARYARQPLLVAELATALETVRRAVIQRSTRQMRIRAIVLPPSLISRWHTAALTTGSRLAVVMRLRQDKGWRLLNPRHRHTHAESHTVP